MTHGGFMYKRRNERMKEQITIRLPVELKEKLQQEADERGYSITELIIFILWDSFSATIHQE